MPGADAAQRRPGIEPSASAVAASRASRTTPGGYSSRRCSMALSLCSSRSVMAQTAHGPVMNTE